MPEEKSGILRTLEKMVLAVSLNVMSITHLHIVLHHNM